MTYWILLLAAFAYFLGRAILNRTTNVAMHEGIPDSVTTGQLTATLLATAIGGGLIIGMLQLGRSAGGLAIFLGVVYCLSFLGLGILAPSVRSICFRLTAPGTPPGRRSVTELFAQKYDRRAWGVVVLAYSLVYIAFLAAQFVAVAQIIEAMDIELSVTAAIIIMALATYIYVAAAGFKMVVASDVIQLALATIILLAGVILLVAEGAMPFSDKPESYYNPFATSKTTSDFVWLSIFVFPTLLLRLDHWQRIITAKSDVAARRGYWIAALLLLLVFVTLAAIGSISSPSENSAFWLYNKHLLSLDAPWGELLHAFVLTCFVCAVMSSADTVLNSCITNIMQSLRAWQLVRHDSEMRATVILGAALTALALGLALKNKDVVRLIVEGFKAMAMILPCIVAAFILKKPSSIAAGVSILGGALVYLSGYLFPLPRMEWSYLFGFAAALILFILVSRIESAYRHSSDQ